MRCTRSAFSAAPCPCILWLHFTLLDSVAAVQLLVSAVSNACHCRLVATLHSTALHSTVPLDWPAAMADSAVPSAALSAEQLRRRAKKDRQRMQRAAQHAALAARVSADRLAVVPGADAGTMAIAVRADADGAAPPGAAASATGSVWVKCGEGIGDGLCVGLPDGGSGFGHYGDCRAGGSECYFGCPAIGRRLCSRRLGGAAAGSRGCGPSLGGGGGPSSGSLGTGGACCGARQRCGGAWSLGRSCPVGLWACGFFPDCDSITAAGPLGRRGGWPCSEVGSSCAAGPGWRCASVCGSDGGGRRGWACLLLIGRGSLGLYG